MSFRRQLVFKLVKSSSGIRNFISRISDIYEDWFQQTQVPDDFPDVIESIRNLLSHSTLHNQRPLERLGNWGDGGYVILPFVEDGAIVVSLGVGDDVSFERDLAPRCAGVVFVDDSVECLPESIPGSFFIKKRVGAKEANEVNLEQVMHYAHEQFSRVSFEEDNFILKMDIEGSEWEVLDQIDVNLLKSFHQLVIEFHGLLELTHKEFSNRVKAVFSKLRENHLPIWIHPNNYGEYKIVAGYPIPDVIEITFARKDLLHLPQAKIGTRSLGQRQDQIVSVPNNPQKPDIRNFIDFSL